MTEEVNTGGVKRFVHIRGEQPKIDEGLKREIEQAYGQYYGRRAREEKRKKILWILGGLIILILMGFAVWRLLG